MRGGVDHPIFTDAEFGPKSGWEIKQVLGKSCSMILSHNPVGDKIYANIDGLGPLPKGVKPPAQVNSSVFFSLEGDFNHAVFNDLPDYLKALIMKSPEWQLAVSGDSDSDHQPLPASDEPNDEIPF